ncbi:hypothetical protein [Roseomonas sp. BN140053]|uniref:hypothetical protein n=1 Tax=Roseomonas sp. BN140053 TaxID=3391898 RepID=UPI0039EB99CC
MPHFGWPMAAFLTGLALVPALARAQEVRTVVVPAGSGVVVAPRSAPPRMAARPAPAPMAYSTVAPAPVPAETAPSALLPALSLIPLAAAAALFAGSTAGGGGGTGGPARTR